MVSAQGLSPFARAYVRTVSALGVCVICASFYNLYLAPVEAQWLLLAALTLISGSASVKLSWANVSISISEAFVFTAVLLYGSSAGTLTVALDALVISFWIAKRRPQLNRAIFNISAPALSAWCSSHLFFLVSGIGPLSERGGASQAAQPAPVPASILPSLALFAIAYFALNSWLIAIVIALEKRLNPWAVWKKGLLWLSLNYFCGASVAFLLVGFSRTVDLRFVAVVLPMLLVLYFTFRTSMQRVQDATRHLDEMNALYLSTIETLAMAIDAKDQVTHGHIRRVQLHAISLARQVGVRDHKLLQAIEAAALLHDMGKLAVPEYILNKPGKLTAVEFEKMKLHASVGADILSAIEFPYPVVPIVRHHHENWDGTGYPAGLRGTDIPIGARILSVVDCFDALTSDRPYRPKLSDQEAFAILMDRRGSMYDPFVVDSFMRMHALNPSESIQVAITSGGHGTIAPSRNSASQGAARLDEISASTDETLSVYELSRALAGGRTVTDAGDVISKHLRRLIPSSLCVLYIHDHQSGEIEASHASGDGSPLVRGLRIGLGQRLSGWVAANRQTICNSDATLDLGDIARAASLRLRNCASTPLVWNDDLVGVLSLYSTEANGFTEDHRRILEAVAPQVAHTLHRIHDGGDSFRGSFGELPHFDQIEHLIQSVDDNQGGHAVLFISIKDLHKVTSEYGDGARDEVLAHTARNTRASLRTGDILFRSRSDDLVAFLRGADARTADVVANAIRENIVSKPVRVAADLSLTVKACVTIAVSPQDGLRLRELQSVARERAEGSKPYEGPVH